MKYAIVKIVNGNYFVEMESIPDINTAKANYHRICNVLWSAEDVLHACVAVVDEQLNIVDRCKEIITH